jgi:hypothetical protein
VASALYRHNGNTNATKSKAYKQPGVYVIKGDLPLHVTTTRRTADLLAKADRKFDFRILHHGQPVSVKLHRIETRRQIVGHCEAVYKLSVFICFCSVASLVERGCGGAASGGRIQGAAKLILSMDRDFFHALNTF